MNRALLHGCIACAICCACLLNLSATAFGAWRSFRESPAAEAAIVSSRALETCHHHPQGCPKDCFCPKIRVEAQPEDPSPPASGTLRETSWVNCSEEGPSAPRALFAWSLPAFAPEIFLPSARGERRAEAGSTPLDATSLPPQKIPIA